MGQRWGRQTSVGGSEQRRVGGRELSRSREGEGRRTCGEGSHAYLSDGRQGG